MIKATVFKNSTDSGNAVYTGIVMEGHAGYADEGEDIICAAVSALALNFFNSVEAFTEDGFEGGTGESGSFEFRFTSDISPESKLLMNSLILGLQNIERDYGKSYINVKFKEV